MKVKVTDTHTASETVTSNDNMDFKTAIEEKEEEFTSIDQDLLSKLKSNNMDKIIKRYELKDSRTIQLADNLLKNEIYLGDKWDPVTINQPTWLEDPYNDNSWVLYYQSLDFLPYLLNAYEETGKLEYLEKANFFVFGWIKSNREIYDSKSEFAWNDHGTANRVLNLIQFWKSYRESSLYKETDAKELIYSLVQHGNYLNHDGNYTKSNHGIMQDQALMELSVLFPQLPKAKEWFEKADNRLLESVERDVAQDGVHKEHSPSYHTMVKGLFTDIKGFMEHYDRYHGEFDTALEKMEKYQEYIIMPDKKYPTVGDSENTKVYGVNEVPILKDAVFKDGGVAFFRNNWSTAENPLYFMFTAAFHSGVHKHADDLSFILSYGQTNYFVDSGKYNYASKDPYRQYVTSVFAHNSIAVNGKSYEPDTRRIGQSEITGFESTPSYSFVSGRHTLYDNVKIERTVIYLKPNNIVIHDQILSDEENKYSQIFNVGENVEVNKISNQEFLLESKVDTTSIKLTQLSSDDLEGVDIYNGSEDPIRGWQSNTLNEKHPITSISFNKKGENQSYITTINLDRSDSVKNVKYSSKRDSYEIEMDNNTKINISKLKKETER
ncbi:heparinase II/III family protein [Strepomyces sp. STD 3.1]|nr:heparinase II/III family protein [Streptomyces sp. STD 3.1]